VVYPSKFTVRDYSQYLLMTYIPNWLFIKKEIKIKEFACCNVSGKAFVSCESKLVISSPRREIVNESLCDLVQYVVSFGAVIKQ